MSFNERINACRRVNTYTTRGNDIRGTVTVEVIIHHDSSVLILQISQLQTVLYSIVSIVL